jgi:hypothetical protein
MASAGGIATARRTAENAPTVAAITLTPTAARMRGTDNRYSRIGK